MLRTASCEVSVGSSTIDDIIRTGLKQKGFISKESKVITVVIYRKNIFGRFVKAKVTHAIATFSIVETNMRSPSEESEYKE